MRLARANELIISCKEYYVVVGDLFEYAADFMSIT